MSKPRVIVCESCSKRLYPTELFARHALGEVMAGRWKDRPQQNSFALSVYECPVQKGWHIGHNPRTLKVIMDLKRKTSVLNSSRARP